MLEIVINMTDDNGVKSIKTFDNIPDGTAETKLEQLASKYVELTNSVTRTAEKIVTTPLEFE